MGRAAGVAGNGQRLWRSAEEFADTGEFREFLEREFPAGASRLVESSRRTFLRLMGASVALAGAATIPGCRRPDHTILPYSKNVPEEVIPGKPLYYATSLPIQGGGAEGLLVETHEGRPTKVEGNPLHPINRGKSSIWSQACVLDLYDPDRTMSVVYRGGAVEKSATWDDFRAWSLEHFAGYDASGGQGLAFLVEKKSSPTRAAIRDRIRARWPKADWVPFDACDSPSAVEGARIALGSPMAEVFDFTKARVVVSLDRNVLHGEAGSLRWARDFASTRRVKTTGDTMSRLYVVESGVTETGSQADHRLRLAPTRVAAFAVALAKEILANRRVRGSESLRRAVNAISDPGGGSLDRRFIEELAKDLMDSDHLGRSIIVAGPTQPPEVHALVHALNGALGNVGSTVRYRPIGADVAADSARGIAELSRRINGGQVSTLVVIGSNPVFNAPGDLDFGEKFKSVQTTICLSLDHNETESLATWSINAAHALESWGDAAAWDGTISPIQPMIAPLYDGVSDIELLDLIATRAKQDEWEQVKPDGHALVQATWRGRLGEAGFDKRWRRALHDGVISAGSDASAARIDYDAVAEAASRVRLVAGPGEGSLEVVFTPTAFGDGRLANNAWIQELPQFGTRIVWDNPALVSPATARRLGLEPDSYTVKEPKGHMARVSVNGRRIEMPVWILPGMADQTILLPMGLGRTVCGLVARKSGFNVFPLRESAGALAIGGAGLERIAGKYPISSTQNHWSMEGRTGILRQVDLAAWKKFGDDPFGDLDERGKEMLLRDAYGRERREMNFAERLGESAHSPANVSIYDNPFNESREGAAPGSRYAKRPQWGMSIDLSSCIGCGVCTIACQSENNIPVVGKKEVRKGREMTWIRVDRYYVGEELDDPSAVVSQPVTCQQCENAPCETVCPVNATVHGPEGLNEMVYNRCIGTRYCANNCPYKVRRFNFFDWSEQKFNGNYVGKDLMPGGGPENVNLIPPLVRERLDEISKMRMNPNVTVRSRGVMEKCTFCVQRLNAARVESKLQGLSDIPDGFVQSACQQACPADAISFGDLLDESSRVHEERASQLSYRLLGFLDTRPRLTYRTRVWNPNPRLVDQARRRTWDNPFGHGEGGHEESGGGEGHAFLFDSNKTARDRGYALSLRVLGAGVNA